MQLQKGGEIITKKYILTMYCIDKVERIVEKYRLYSLSLQKTYYIKKHT